MLKTFAHFIHHFAHLGILDMGVRRNFSRGGQNYFASSPPTPTKFRLVIFIQFLLSNFYDPKNIILIFLPRIILTQQGGERISSNKILN